MFSYYNKRLDRQEMIPGKPETKIYFVLCRDKKGFDRKFKTIGFKLHWRVAAIESEFLGIGNDPLEFSFPKDPTILFQFSEWLNHTTALYLECQ